MASPCTGDTPSPPLQPAGMRMKQKSRFKCLPWPGFEPRTSQSNGSERYHSTTAHPQLYSIYAMLAHVWIPDELQALTIRLSSITFHACGDVSLIGQSRSSFQERRVSQFCKCLNRSGVQDHGFVLFQNLLNG